MLPRRLGQRLIGTECVGSKQRLQHFGQTENPRGARRLRVVPGGEALSQFDYRNAARTLLCRLWSHLPSSLRHLRNTRVTPIPGLAICSSVKRDRLESLSCIVKSADRLTISPRVAHPVVDQALCFIVLERRRSPFVNHIAVLSAVCQKTAFSGRFAHFWEL